MGLVGLLLLSALHYPRKNRRLPFSPQRLVLAYGAVLLACLAISAVSGYVPQTEATARWHVPAERYWQVQLNGFAVLFVLMAWLSLFGVALVGLPIVSLLARHGRATVPWVLAASVVVSVTFAVVASLATNPAHIGYTAAYFSATHLLLSLAFCLASGLPWQRTASEA